MSKPTICELCDKSYTSLIPFYNYVKYADVTYKYYGCSACVQKYVINNRNTTSLGGGKQKYDKYSINT